MIIILLALTFSICIVSMFSFSQKYTSIDRIITYFPKQVIECAVPLIDSYENEKFYFDRELLKKKCEEYFDSVVYQYVTSYDVNYLFYESEGSNICTVDENCQRVEITFKTKIDNLYDYKRTMYYEIKDMLNG